jgi:hypothetical protein
VHTPPESAPMIDRLLVSLLQTSRRWGEDDLARIRRWFTMSEPGQQLTRYLSDEAGLLAMAANRLNLSGDEELREMGRELGRSAERLWTLMGVPQGERR